MYFNYMEYPSCCIAGIIYNFGTTKGGNKMDMIALKSKTNINVVYAMDISGNFVDELTAEGFQIVDTNFNNNSGNMVFTLKYVYGKR